MFRKDNFLPVFYIERLDNMRTTINADTILINRLKEAMAEVDLPKDKLIELLLSRIIIKNSFVPKPCEAVKYQDGGPDKVWKIEHINLESLSYEKVQDFRRHFKFSVSWFIAFGIINYLDELVSELRNSGNSEKNLDNYTRNYAYIYEIVGSIRVFLTIMETQSKKT